MRQQQILSDLKNQVGCSLDCQDLIINKIIPAAIFNWPEIQSSKYYINGSQFLKIEKSIDNAKAEFELSDSKSWPDLLIGAKIEYDSKNIAGGFSFSLPLPIFNANQSEKKSKQRKWQIEKDMQKIRKTQLMRRRATLIEKYQKVVAVIKQIDLKTIEKNHKKLHQFLKQGILPFALAVETHNEYLSFYEEKHKAELDAITYFWSVLAIDGRIFEEVKK